MGDIAASAIQGSVPTPISSSLDFCVQKTTSHGSLVAVYLRPSEADIDDLLPRLVEYATRDFKMPVSALVLQVQKIFVKQYSLFPELDDLFENRDEFHKRTVTQLIFRYNRKREVQAAIEVIR